MLSPMLFNLYLEKIFSVDFENEEIRIKINGKRINNIRYADGSAIITENLLDMLEIIVKLERIGNELMGVLM